MGHVALAPSFTGLEARLSKERKKEAAGAETEKKSRTRVRPKAPSVKLQPSGL